MSLSKPFGTQTNRLIGGRLLIDTGDRVAPHECALPCCLIFEHRTFSHPFSLPAMDTYTYPGKGLSLSQLIFALNEELKRVAFCPS